MLMPSLFKYFAFVGAALFALISLANFLLEPSTGATSVASTPPKRTIVVQHDPRASKIERWRDEQAALKAAEQTQTTANASLDAKSNIVTSSVTKSVTKAAEPVRPAPAPTAQAAAAPAPQVAPQPLSQPAPQVASQPQSQPAAQVAAAAVAAPTPAPEPAAAAAPAIDTSTIMGTESTDERAAKAAEHKAKVARAKARKEKLARDRAIAAQTEAALNGGYYPRTASNTQDQYYYGQRGGQQFTTRYSSAYAPQPNFGPFGWGRGW